MTTKSAVSGLILATLLGALLLAASGRPAADKSNEADRAAIVAVLTSQQNDWNKGDIRGFMAG
jgi:hypothetical protein